MAFEKRKPRRYLSIFILILLALIVFLVSRFFSFSDISSKQIEIPIPSVQSKSNK